MFICQICRRPSSPGEKLHRHYVYKAPTTATTGMGRQIAHVIEVCEVCKQGLCRGVPRSILAKMGGNPKPTESPTYASSKLESSRE